MVLADKNFDLKFANRHFAEFIQIPPEIARPGRSAYDVLRCLARRGDFGSVESEKDVERIVQERAAIIRTPGGARYERRMGDGRYVELNFQQLANESVLGLYRDLTVLTLASPDLPPSPEGADRLAAFGATRSLAGLPAISARLDFTTRACLALVTEGEAATALFQDALGMSETLRWPFDVAQVQLHYAQHLRRSHDAAAARLAV